MSKRHPPTFRHFLRIIVAWAEVRSPTELLPPISFLIIKLNLYVTLQIWKYRRADIKGGTYFFTINLADRNSNLLIEEIDKLRTSINQVKKSHHFVLDAMVVLPDLLHLLITLPEGDSDFPTRIRLIKSGLTRQLPKTEKIKQSRISKQESGIWQRRYWEHFIRDEADYKNHVDYIHYNPVKHGYVDQAVKWEYSTIHRYTENGFISHDWGCNQDNSLDTPFGER